MESGIKNSQRRAGEFDTKVGVAFEKEDRYHFLVKRQAEIEDKLDLAKNQAPSQIEDSPNDEANKRVSQKRVKSKTTERENEAGVRV